MFHFGRKINKVLYIASSLVITIGISGESCASETANALLGKMLVSNTDIAKPAESSPNATPATPTPAGASSLASVLSPAAPSLEKPADIAPQTVSPTTTTTPVAGVPAEATVAVKPADIALQTVSPTAATTTNAIAPAVLSPAETTSQLAVKSDVAQAAMPAPTTAPAVQVPVGATSKKQDGLVSEGGTVLTNDKGFPGMKDGEWFMYVADVEEFKKKLDSDEKQQGNANQAGVDGDQYARQQGQQLPFGPTPVQNQMPFGSETSGQNMQNPGQAQFMGGTSGQNMPLNPNMQNGQQMPFNPGMQNQNGQRFNGVGQNGQSTPFGSGTQNPTDQGGQNLPMLTLLVNGNGKTVKYECSAK